MSAADRLIAELMERAERRSQRAVAQALGITPAQVCRIANGSRKPGQVFIRRIRDRYPDLMPLVVDILNEVA